MRGGRFALGLLLVAVVAGTRPLTFVRPSVLLAQIRAPRPHESDDIRIVAGRPQLSGRNAIVADIDRDGDLDVIGSSSDALLAVWINDGSNHFTRTVPAQKRVGLGDGAAAYREVIDRSILAAPPTPKWFAAALSSRAPRAPDAHAGARPSLRSLRILRRDSRAIPSRAPPGRFLHS
jgi:hypothetical protein